MAEELEIVETEQVDNGQEQEAPQSLREQIESAAKEVKETKEPKEEIAEKPKSGRERDEAGKFAAKETKVAKETTVETPAAVTPAEPDIPVPQGFTQSLSEHWKAVPKEIKMEVARREQELHRKITTNDEERLQGRKFKEIVTPYMAQIRAEGGEPLAAVQQFFNIAHILRTGTQAQKQQILRDTAAQFGVDLAQAQQGQPRVDPYVAQALQETQMLKQQLAERARAEQQQKEASLVELVNTFASDQTNYPHFASVEAEMMALLQGGMFKDDKPADRLKKVYDYAVHANPQTRSTLIQNAQMQSQEKRVADEKAKAEAARKAGSSVRGKPGMASASQTAPSGSLREQLRAGWREAREA